MISFCSNVNLQKSIAIAWYWVWINLILFDIAFVSLCEKIFLLLFDIVNLHFATFTNYLYCLLKIKVLDYCLVAFGHKKMQFCPTLSPVTRPIQSSAYSTIDVQALIHKYTDEQCGPLDTSLPNSCIQRHLLPWLTTYNPCFTIL